MAKFLSFRIGPALLGLALLLAVTGAVWAASPESAMNVTSCTPPTGTTCGGTLVDIGGSGFSTGATVTIGGVAATSVVVVDGANIVCNTPAGATGPAVDIVVTIGTDTGTGTGLYTYTTAPVPAVTSLTPTGGSAGTPVTVTGTGFTSATAPAVLFGAGPATSVVVASDNLITCVSPAGSGTVDVYVTTCGGQSPANPPGDQFTYGAVSGNGFVDDVGRAKVCIDVATGNYTWTILTGPLAGHTYPGTATVNNTATLLTLISAAGSPQRISFSYYKTPKVATGTLVSGSVISSLIDTNTTNDPPGLCGSGY